ncbi:SAVED domain-containing protein [Vibrio diabolicus]|uniref:SAVED domain-containing protein n=1 Tax=Vibrio TaxID=662 RepID=UPI00296757A0|nr:SAVED domain-containing protein [Vibrio sp. 779(2023)]MDW3155054.1 SAVED domain-containing protein [Vibrio sp. 779(2023)]
MINSIKYYFNKVFNWYFKPKTLENRLWKLALFLLSTGIGSGLYSAINVTWKYSESESISAGYSTQDSVTAIITYSAFLIGVLSAFWASYLGFKRERRNPNIFLEHIGLRYPKNQSLTEASKKKTGLGSSLFIDISNYYNQGLLVSNKQALDYSLACFKNTFTNLMRNADTTNVTLHYGGTPSVPIGFVLGHSIGNISKISLWDFNRDKSEWYALEDVPPDSNIPIINWEDYRKTDEVCLLMGISFEVTHQQVGSLLNGRGIVSVSMPEVKYDSMSSLAKVEGFQQKFREILKKFNTDGVKRVHIFCAAQSSFNFAMGRQVERNHPECIVYEYVNNSGNITHYPWGVLFNVRGQEPSIIET